jgi:hypothetical protein
MDALNPYFCVIPDTHQLKNDISMDLICNCHKATGL